jgi:DNA-directed RNA polymerase II subunit RPB2
MDSATIWNIIDTYFQDNPQALVRHHIDSYNDFFKNGIFRIFKETKPVTIYSRLDPATNEYMSQCKLYMGGKDGSKIYFGKPVIHDDKNVHFMFPNEARMRNMNYSMTIHYDIEVEFIDKLMPGQAPTVIGSELLKETRGGGVEIEIDGESYKEINGGSISDAVTNDLLFKQTNPDSAIEDDIMTGGGPKKTALKKKKDSDQIRLAMTTNAAAQLREASENTTDGNTQRRMHTLERIFLGKFPIMVQSDFCVLQGLSKDIRHSMGECKNDMGGYFIIDGKEKTVIAQESFADNMLYVRKVDDDNYLYSAEIRSVSENVSKPVRTLSVKMCTPTSKYTNHQLVVKIPNVRAPVPLFIVFRALGIISDKDIISYCLLDMDKYESMVDLFIPCVHDASTIMTQQNALKYIALLTKGKGISHALEILTDYFLPHVGETNYITKAYTLGDMVFRLLSISSGIEPPTDRDNFKFKRIELVGSLLYDLFREYFMIQQRQIHLEFEKKLYYNQDMYEDNLFGLITQNYSDIFRERAVDSGFKKAFKGNWGAHTHTKRIGVIQDLNRLSFNSALNHLRKTSLPLDSGLKIVAPRLLHNSQWGFIDPIDTPDGGNIGLHKHLSLSTYISRGISREPMIEWVREKWGMKLVEEYTPLSLAQSTKVMINGFFVGAVDEPINCIKTFRLYRRNALLPIYSSAAFDIRLNTIFVYTDAGRLCRPIFYRDDSTNKLSYQSKSVLSKLQDNKFSWNELITGFNKKRDNVHFNPAEMQIYKLYELYEGVESETNPAKLERFLKDKAILDYIDSSESEHALIAINTDTFETTSDKTNRYTHCEIHNALMFGVMCNMIVFPENNPATRNLFSTGQSKQACSMYHSNYQSRMDKTATVLNYGQTPLIKSRFLDYITKEENPYGENVIVAVACYTGYNVEDAMLVNEGSIKRGMFRTSYFTCYESHEEKSKEGDSINEKKFTNIADNLSIVGTKPGYDYSKLDEYGIIKEGTVVDDKTALIGLVSIDSAPQGSVIESEPRMVDGSKMPKKGQVGVVDRVFMTDDEDGKRIAKVRLLEQRIPTLGDKMASRAGQKGTVGMVVPERDMPFTADGIRPDIIINPHAIPSRMTIGQFVEVVTGKACAMYGGFGDCTAFNNKGSKVGVFGEMLTKEGFHSNGNEVMYNGMTGEQLETEIFIGPTYYMRLKHMVKDKVNYRALGPRTALTKQPVSGRANDGGLRIGEMERDTVISHGMTDFLRESMMERGDKSYLAVCNHTGMISIYNPAKEIFMSPMADGPLKFIGSLEGDDMRLEHITKFGRNFSIVCIPYSFKLLIQELQTINAQLRIITEDNIEQIESMSFSHNIQTLLDDKEATPKSLIESIQQRITQKQIDRVQTPADGFTIDELDSPEYAPTSPAYRPLDSEGNPIDTDWGSYDPNASEKSSLQSIKTPEYAPTSPAYIPLDSEGNPVNTDWGSYDPNSPYVSPENKEESLKKMEGGNSPSDYKIGQRVCMRKCKDKNTRRPWEITHIGSKFITIRAIDKEALSELDQVNVVSNYDIFPEEHAHMYIPQIQSQALPEDIPQIQPIPTNTSTQPTVIIAPKFFNGNGSDNSTSELPSESLDSNQNIMSEPSMVIKSNIDTANQSDTEVDSNKEVDFSKGLVIKKQGQ